MTVDQSSPVSRGVLIDQLFASETGENNDLITILGSVKPTRSSKSSLVSILRGLYTKNTKLLQLLNNYRNNVQEPDYEVEQFKSFVNEFIIWMDNGGIVLYEKFLACFLDKNLVLHEDVHKYSKPIRNATAYISFMSAAKAYIRNPFVMEKLQLLSTRFESILKNYQEFQMTNSLCNISFSNVAAFPWHSTSTKVASYFVAEQIVDRSFGQEFILENHQGQVEIALLNLSNSKTPRSFDAMALLSVDSTTSTTNPGSRSLLYPPCRYNELFVELEDDCITLRPINFSTDELSVSEMSLRIKGKKDQAQKWFSKLATIFPSKHGECLPIGPDANCSLAGLGINIHLSSGSESPEFEASSGTPSFKELLDSPTGPKEMVKPPHIKTSSHLSHSSISSVNSVESARNQYDRSLNIIHKTLSGPHENHESVMKYISRKTLSPEDEMNVCSNGRPRSEQAEVAYDTPESKSNNEPVDLSDIPLSSSYLAGNEMKFKSAPEIGKQTSSEGLFKLSNGSAIDISNFGRTHQPSFSVAHGLSDISQLTESLSLDKTKKKRKSILGLFKKRNMETAVRSEENTEPKSKTKAEPKEEKEYPNEPETNESKANRNVKDLSITTDIPRNIDLAQPLSTISERSGSPGPRSALPSPFALPSSTSTYFFKPYINGSSVSLALQDVAEETISIPQHLKDIINDDLSIDFYISPSSPKTLKVSRWKEKYGKWEMLTTNDMLFLKIVVNYEYNKAWLIVFKEEYDEGEEDIVDKPLLLLNINSTQTEVRQSSALDAQISTVNAITNDRIKILLRCSKGNLAHAIFTNLSNILGVLASNKSKDMRSQASSSTLTSSVMEGMTSKSTTISSVSSMITDAKQPPKSVLKESSLQTCNSDEITRAHILSNPENSKLMVVNRMTVRLQKLTEGYERVKFSSSWKIISMYALTVYIISDHFTDANYYHLVLDNLDDNDKENFNWLFKEDSKLSIIEKVGKAGLLVKLAPEELYMVECRGKKELKSLIEIF